jgi:hypothetical protein
MLCKDTASNFYYPKLMKRFLSTDTTLNDDEIVVLRYGYTQQPEYDPLKDWSHDDSLKHYNTIGDFQKTIEICLVYLNTNPISLRGNLAMMQAYYALGEMKYQKQYRMRYLQLIKGILSTGDGFMANSAYFLINYDEEILVLDYLGYKGKFTLGSRDSRTYDGWDAVSLQDPTDQRHIVFDVTLPYDYANQNVEENEAFNIPFPEPNVDENFYCTPDTAYLGDTVILHFPMPHGNEELALNSPNANYLIHIPYEGVASDYGGRNSVISDSKFIATPCMKISTKTFMARPYVHGKKKEIVFNKTGYYEFEMAPNLETDSGVRGITTEVYFINRHKKHK